MCKHLVRKKQSARGFMDGLKQSREINACQRKMPLSVWFQMEFWEVLKCARKSYRIAYEITQWMAFLWQVKNHFTRKQWDDNTKLLAWWQKSPLNSLAKTAPISRRLECPEAPLGILVLWRVKTIFADEFCVRFLPLNKPIIYTLEIKITDIFKTQL